MDITCEGCGEENAAGTEFCTQCGDFLSWTARPTPRPSARPTSRHSSHVGGAARTAVVTTPSTTATARRGPVPLPLPPDRTSTGSAPQAGTATVDPTDRCPACGQQTQPERYFCGSCGHQLRPSPAAQRLPPRRTRTSWWARLWDERDRRARRDFRRSLPPSYRWRRVVVSLVVATLVVTFAVVSQGRPVAWVRSRVDDLRKTLVVVPQVQVEVRPQQSTVAPSTAGSLLDRTGQAWTTRWSATTQGNGCAPAPGTGVIVLTFAPRRIRAIDVYAGLSDALPDRALQFRPHELAVDFGTGSCRVLTLEDRYHSPKLSLDSGVPVTSVQIGVISAYPPPAGGADFLSVSEIALLSRPLR